MWSPTSCSPNLESKREGRKLVSVGAMMSTVVALPAVSRSVRYFEVEVIKNKGAVYIGWMEDALEKTFPWKTSGVHAFVGWKEGSFAVNSQSGSIGTKNVWEPYFGRKIRNGDVIGSILDLEKGEVRFLLRSTAARNLPDVFPALGLPVDPTKTYHASVSLKHAQTKIYGTFTHPFALWDMITAEFGNSDLFVPSPHLPFRLVTPTYNKEFPLPLSSASHRYNEQALQLATERYNSNLNHLGLLSLPFDLIIRILTFLNIQDIPHVSASCRSFHEGSADSRIWNAFVQRDYHFGLVGMTRQFFGKLAQLHKEKKLTDSDAMEAMYRDPYRIGFETASQASKERYKITYHWHKGRYDLLPSFPTENNVKAIAYDEDRRILFYSEAERFYSYSFISGNISLGLFSTVGEILRMKHLAPGLLFLATDFGFFHIIETTEGSQLARISQNAASSFDVHIDHETDTTLVVFGTKNHSIVVWKVNGLVRRAQHIRNLPRNRHLHSNSILGDKSTLDDSEDDEDADFGFHSDGDAQNSNSSASIGTHTDDSSDEEDSDSTEEDEDVLVQVGTPTIVWENLTAHKKKIMEVSFLPLSKGTQIVSASQDGEVLFWRLITPIPNSSHDSDPKSTLYHGQSSLSGAQEMDQEVLDEETDSETSSVSSGPKRDPNDPIDDPIKDLDSCGFNYGAKPWGRWKMVSSASALSELVCMSLSPEGLFGAVASSRGEIMLFDAKDASTGAASALPVVYFSLSFKNRAHSTSILHMHYDCGGKLITTHDDNTVRYWDQKTGKHTWAYCMALPPSTLFCHDAFLSFGTIHGRLFTMDFAEVDLPEERLAVALKQKRTYLEALARNPSQSSV